MKLILNAKKNLLECGRSYLIHNGIDGLTISRITRECGMAAGTFYHYFDSKESYIRTIMDGDWNHVLEKMQAILTDEGASVRDQLENIYREIGGFDSKYRITLAEAAGTSSYYTEIFAGGRKKAAAILSRFLRAKQDSGILNAAMDEMVMGYMVLDQFASIAAYHDITFDQFYESLILFGSLHGGNGNDN